MWFDEEGNKKEKERWKRNDTLHLSTFATFTDLSPAKKKITFLNTYLNWEDFSQVYFAVWALGRLSLPILSRKPPWGYLLPFKITNWPFLHPQENSLPLTHVSCLEMAHILRDLSQKRCSKAEFFGSRTWHLGVPHLFFLAKWPWGFIFKMACQETLFYCTLTTNSFLLFTFGALLNFDVFSYHNWFRTGKFPWVVERPSPVQREEGPLAGNVERSQHTCQS